MPIPVWLRCMVATAALGGLASCKRSAESKAIPPVFSHLTLGECSGDNRTACNGSGCGWTPTPDATNPDTTGTCGDCLVIAVVDCAAAGCTPDTDLGTCGAPTAAECSGDNRTACNGSGCGWTPEPDAANPDTAGNCGDCSLISVADCAAAGCTPNTELSTCGAPTAAPVASCGDNTKEVDCTAPSCSWTLPGDESGACVAARGEGASCICAEGDTSCDPYADGECDADADGNGLTCDPTGKCTADPLGCEGLSDGDIVNYAVCCPLPDNPDDDAEDADNAGNYWDIPSQACVPYDDGEIALGDTCTDGDDNCADPGECSPWVTAPSGDSDNWCCLPEGETPDDKDLCCSGAVDNNKNCTALPDVCPDGDCP